MWILGKTFSRRTPFEVLSLLACVAALAGKAASAAEFFDHPPETAPAHSDADLNRLFTQGIGPYATTMAGKIYPYRLPEGGIQGNPTYNGCYNRKNERLGNLDSDNSCTSTIAAHPEATVLRLFMGYKIACMPNELVGTVCNDAQLTINCEFRQVSTGPQAFENAALSSRLCATERGMVRRAKGTTAAAPTYSGCRPGEDGTTLPTCDPCAAGTYNDRFDPNTAACKPCTKTVDHSTAFVLDSPVRSTSNNDCRVKAGTLNCATGYAPAPDDQTCILVSTPPTCSLSLSFIPTNPTGVGMTNGAITASYSGASGPVSAFSITSPTAMNPTSSSGSTANFTGLGANTYTVSATDSACTTSASVTLTNVVPSPTPSSTPPTVCSAGQGSVLGDGSDCTTCAPGTYKAYTGNFACTACPGTSITSGMNLTYSSAPGSTMDTACNVSYTCSTGTVQQSPAPYTSVGYTTAKCNIVNTCALTISATVTNPPSTSTSNDGAFKIDVGGTAGKTSTLKVQRNGANLPGYFPYSVGGTPASVALTGMSSGNYQWVVEPADSTCTVSGQTYLTLAPTACPATTLALAATGTYPTGQFTNDGSLLATTTGGTPPISIQVYSSDGLRPPGPVVGASHTFTGLRQLVYTVQAWDATGSISCAQMKYVDLQPPCDIATDNANSYINQMLTCNFDCGASIDIGLGRCSDPSIVAQVRNNFTGCAAGSPTSCVKHGKGADDCAARTCPAGKYKHLVWDAGGYGWLLATEGGTDRGGTCTTGSGPSGNMNYFCSDFPDAPYLHYPAEFGQCSQFSGFGDYSSLRNSAPPYNGGPVCTQ